MHQRYGKASIKFHLTRGKVFSFAILLMLSQNDVSNSNHLGAAKSDLTQDKIVSEKVVGCTQGVNTQREVITLNRQETQN